MFHQNKGMTNTDAQSLAALVLQERPAPELLERWQKQVFDETLRLSSTLEHENFNRASQQDLLRLAMLIDEHHFGGRLLPLARREGLEIAWSSRMTKTAEKRSPRGNGTNRTNGGFPSSSVVRYFSKHSATWIGVSR